MNHIKCFFFQVLALTDGPNPMEHPRTPREDNINHLIGDYMDRRLKAMGLVEEKVSQSSMGFFNSLLLNKIIFIGMKRNYYRKIVNPVRNINFYRENTLFQLFSVYFYGELRNYSEFIEILSSLEDHNFTER